MEQSTASEILEQQRAKVWEDAKNPYKVFAIIPPISTFAPKVAGDVGHDLYVRIREEDMTWLDKIASWYVGHRVLLLIPVVGKRVLSSGVRVCMKDTMWCEIRARSSTSRKNLQVLGGTIDSGYTGELFTVLHNFGWMPRVIEDGERYSQVVFYPAVRPVVIPVTEETFNQVAEDKKRGSAGFGSTGA